MNVNYPWTQDILLPQLIHLLRAEWCFHASEFCGTAESRAYFQGLYCLCILCSCGFVPLNFLRALSFIDLVPAKELFCLMISFLSTNLATITHCRPERRWQWKVIRSSWYNNEYWTDNELKNRTQRSTIFWPRRGSDSPRLNGCSGTLRRPSEVLLTNVSLWSNQASMSIGWISMENRKHNGLLVLSLNWCSVDSSCVKASLPVTIPPVGQSALGQSGCTVGAKKLGQYCI